MIHLCTKRVATFITATAVLTLYAATALGSVPVSMTQQGKLVDNDGDPVTGEQTLEFAIYDEPEGGAVLWSDVIETDLSDTGVYTVTLGDEGQPINADLLRDAEQAYLSLTVGSEEMSPRLELTSVPFASVAHSAEHASVADAVVDGAIDADALAEGAVTKDAVDSVRWSQIQDIPSDVASPSDTLQELSCGSDELAVYDGSSWICSELPSYSGSDFALADQTCSGDDVAVGISTSGQIQCTSQQDTTYSAGSGLSLSGTQFSVDDGYFDGQYHPTGQDLDLGSNDLFVGGYGEIEVDAGSEGTTGDGNIVMGTFSENTAMHIQQDWTKRGLALERSGDVWRLGPSAIGDFYFGYDDEGGDSFSDLARIDRSDGDWVTISDQRLKEDVTSLGAVLEDFLLLEPVTYRMEQASADSTSHGFIAQQVKELFPELVRHDPESGYYSLAYSDFAVLSVQAIREQQQIIDAQQNELEELHRQLDDVDRRLEQLEASQ